MKMKVTNKKVFVYHSQYILAYLMLNSNKLFIFRSSEVKQKGGVRDMDLHKTLGMPHLSIGVDYFLIGTESFMTSVTQRPITIRHVATAKTPNSIIFYIIQLKSTMHTVGTSHTCTWALADNGNLQGSGVAYLLFVTYVAEILPVPDCQIVFT